MECLCPYSYLCNFTLYLRFGVLLVVLQGGEKARFGCKSGNAQILLGGGFTYKKRCLPAPSRLLENGTMPFFFVERGSKWIGSLSLNLPG